MAADCGHIDMIVMLVEEGADLDAVISDEVIANGGA
jgi:hypothetical protein